MVESDKCRLLVCPKCFRNIEFCKCTEKEQEEAMKEVPFYKWKERSTALLKEVKDK